MLQLGKTESEKPGIFKVQ
jgi:hypothetical protein